MAAVVLSAVALFGSLIWCQKELVCCGKCTLLGGTPVYIPGRWEAIVMVLTHGMGTICMLAILVSTLLPSTYSDAEEYEDRTRLWLGLCIARWVLALGLVALERAHRSPAVRPLPGPSVTV
tara:strand:+ start:731 stop:1093 length:363 start_codon:yes stop_codon:yes gene_type:complete